MRKRKKAGKSLVSLFICLCMMVSMIPSEGWASSVNETEMTAGSNVVKTEKDVTDINSSSSSVNPTETEASVKLEYKNKNSANKKEPAQSEVQKKGNIVKRKKADVEKPVLLTETNKKTINMKTLGYTVNGKTTANLNVRKSPTTSSSKIGYFQYGTKIIIKGFVKKNGSTWYETAFNGKKGYVSASYVNENNYKFKNRIGHTTGMVKVYNVSANNTLAEKFSIPKNTDVRIVSRISTNKGNRFSVSYKGKNGFIGSTGINVDPIKHIFKLPMTLKFKTLEATNAYKSTISNGKVLYRIPKNDVVYVYERIARQSYYWYKVKHNGKIVYCKTKDLDVVKYKYKDRTGIALKSVGTYIESKGKVVKNNTILKNQKFSILGRIYTTTDKSIYKVSYKDKIGYILNKNVNLNPIWETFKYADKLTVKLKKDTKMYSGTNTVNKVLYTARKGTNLTISEKIYRDKEPWYKVISNGKTAYCKSSGMDIRSEIIENGERNTTGAFVLYKEVSNHSKHLKTVPSKKRVDVLGKVKTQGKVYLEIKYAGTVGYAIEKNIKNLLSKEYIVESYNYASEIKGETTASTSFYYHASKNSQRAYNVKKGTKFVAIGFVEMNNGKWYKIKYNNKTLYVPTSAAKISKLIYNKITIAYNTVDLNLRAGVSTQSKVKCIIPKRAIIEVKERYQTASGYWYKVKYNGYTGYIKKGTYITFKEVGIDVSKYNTSINWKKVKNSGIDFVFIRLGYTGYGNGVQVEDPYFKDHIEGAIDAGLDIGVYYFTQAINPREAKKEVDFAARVLEPYKRHMKLPLVVDSEFISSDRPGRADHLSKKERTDVLKAFCQRVEYRGYDPMIYMSKSWITGQLNYNEIKQYPIWVAQYNTHNTTPQPYKYWQYTSGGYVSGISGYVDMNIKI